MTSRAEYRLVLRQDNADLRLTERGYEVGLVKNDRYEKYLNKKEIVQQETERLKKKILQPEEIEEFMEKRGSTPLKSAMSLYELLRRPEITYDDSAEIDDERPALSRHQKTMMEVQIKYEGYIEKQRQQIEKFKRLENKKLPADFDYDEIEGLRLEARQKLNSFKPLSIGQASRISGVSPADINVLLIYMEKLRRKNGN